MQHHSPPVSFNTVKREPLQATGCPLFQEIAMEDIIQGFAEVQVLLLCLPEFHFGFIWFGFL